jgi:hypothetical protein
LDIDEKLVVLRCIVGLLGIELLHDGDRVKDEILDDERE